MTFPKLATLLVLSWSLAACAPQASEPPVETQPAQGNVPAAETTESVSILRPEIAPPEPEPTQPPIAPLFVTIGFPDGGSELDADALGALEGVMKSQQIALDRPITLMAHSDSDGSDTANLRSSEARGLAVAKWLIDQGVAPERITVIAFGEQNPVQPNALPDGSANEEGRAANRRVEIGIDGESEVFSADDLVIEFVSVEPEADAASAEARD